MMDSDRPVQRVLRAAAEKRRAEAGPPFDMHPATREMLQGEVSRVYKAARADRQSALSLLQFWPRFAGVAVTVAVLGVLCWMIWPDANGSKPAMDLAKTPEPAAAGYDSLELRNEPVTAGHESRQAVRSIAPSRGRLDQVEGPRLALTDQPPPAPAPNLGLSSDRASVEFRLKEEETRSKGVPAQDFSYGLGMEQKSAVGAPVLSLADRVDPVDSLAAGLAPAPSSAPATEGERLGFQPDSARAYAFSEATPPITAGGTVAAAPRGGFGRFVPSPEESADHTPAFTNTISSGTFRQTLVAGNELGRRQVFHKRLATPGQQSFVRRGAGAVTEKVAGGDGQPLLTSFSVEQLGRELRVFDNDGSVYAGRVQITNAQALGPAQWVSDSEGAAQLATQAVAKDKDNSQAPQFYWFHVSGTNRTLNQQVEFIGNLVQNAAPTEFSNQASYGAAKAVMNNVYQNQAGQAVISGKAVVGGKKEMNIDAQSPPP